MRYAGTAGRSHRCLGSTRSGNSKTRIKGAKGNTNGDNDQDPGRWLTRIHPDGDWVDGGWVDCKPGEEEYHARAIAECFAHSWWHSDGRAPAFSVDVQDPRGNVTRWTVNVVHRDPTFHARKGEV